VPSGLRTKASFPAKVTLAIAGLKLNVGFTGDITRQ
jgi:hypothetical protein